MAPLLWAVLLVGGLIFIWLTMSRGRPPTMNCNRCNGTGQVDEHWPDPSEPSGWHNVTGTCPKCKGKGRI